MVRNIFLLLLLSSSYPECLLYLKHQTIAVLLCFSFQIHLYIFENMSCVTDLHNIPLGNRILFCNFYRRVSFLHKIPVFHLEAGLRTYEKHSPFPEEMFRTLVGKLADLAPARWLALGGGGYDLQAVARAWSAASTKTGRRSPPRWTRSP